MAESEVRKVAENYVRTQIKNWNGNSTKVSKRDIPKGIQKVARALQEVKSASAKHTSR